jgi:hypothetical protein
MKRISPETSYKKGQAMLVAVIFFLVISLTIVLGIATPILRQVKIAGDLIRSKQSYFLAEGVLEDALYQVESGKTVTTGQTVTVGGNTTTISVTSTGSGETLETTTNDNGDIRKMQANITTGVGSSFNYGIQAGTGGFNLSGGSRVNGNVYANGPIYANNGVTITGSAISADSSSLVSDQSNTTPVPITSCTTSTCITFANTSASQDVSESFQVSSSSPVNNVQFYLKKIGSPANITLHIVADNSGSPGTTDLLGSGVSIAASLVSASSFGWVTATIPTNLTLNPTQTYWLVLDATTNSSNYYQIGANTGGYSSGAAKIGQYGGSWTATSPAGLDMYFNLYLGGVTGYIGGGTYVGAVTIGSGGVGNAWAHTVTGASVAGNLYCQTGSNNSVPCNMGQPDPSAQGYPISNPNIQDWEDQASSTITGWTYNGNLTIGYQGTTTTTLGYINGSLTVNGGGAASFSNLIVSGNVTVGGGGTMSVGAMKVYGNVDIQSTLTIGGTLWAVGNFTAESGSTVQLASSYGSSSGVIVTNGYVTVTGGSSFKGSGTTGSYPLIATTSDCPNDPSCSGNNAIEIDGGSGAVILDAQSGTINMSGGTSAQAMTANMIDIENGATVNYSSGLANLNFSSGPSGGYNITGWGEVQ